MRTTGRQIEQNVGGCNKHSDLYKIDPEKCREVERAYYHAYRKNSPNHRENMARLAKKAREEARSEMLSILGANCCVCGYNSNPRGLEIDHIDGGGGSFRQDTKKSFRALLRQVREHPERFQVLCGTCHNIKTYEDNYNSPR